MLWLYITLSAVAALVLVFLIWLFLVGAESGKPLGRLASIRYAHRGLHGRVGGYEEYAAENSLTAFARAVEMGYGIELDVRMSADGAVVVFHDDTALRVCGVDKKILDLTAEELAALRLSGTDDGIPTLSQVLELVCGRVPLLVELKGESTDTTVADKAVELLSGYRGEYIIEAFNPLLLARVRKLNPKIQRGFLDARHTRDKKYRTAKYFMIQHFLLNFLARPGFISMEKGDFGLFPFKLVRRLFGTAALAWTVRSEEEEKEAYRHGFTGIIFENYLGERNDL